MGIYGATIGIAVAIGPLVGGLLTDGLGWESVFLLNVPIGVAALAITYWKVVESVIRTPRAIDWLGLATFSTALFLLVLAFVRGNNEGWGSSPIVSLLAGSGASPRRLHRDRAQGRRADAAARAVPFSGVHRRGWPPSRCPAPCSRCSCT